MSAPAYRAFVAVLKRDLLSGFRHKGEWCNPLLVHLMVVSLFPLALGLEKAMLGELAPAIIWIAALLATVISLDRFFSGDFNDGSLEYLLLSPHSLLLLVSAKILAHWMLTGLPLLVLSLPLSYLLFMPGSAYLPLLFTLLLATPIMSLIGAVLSALTVGLRGGAVLLPLLVLPLYMPVLILAVAALDNAAKGLTFAGELYFLGSMLVVSITIMPLATAASLRVRSR